MKQELFEKWQGGDIYTCQPLLDFVIGNETRKCNWIKTT